MTRTDACIPQVACGWWVTFAMAPLDKLLEGKLHVGAARHNFCYMGDLLLRAQ